MHLLNQSGALEFPSSGYLLSFLLLFTHKTLILIDGEFFSKFLAKSAFSNIALIGTFKNSSVRYLEKLSKLTALAKQQRWSLQAFPPWNQTPTLDHSTERMDQAAPQFP